MKSYLKIIVILIAFLAAGLTLGYLFSNAGSGPSVSLSDGDFSEWFVGADSEIIIYTLPDCPFCHQLKAFLNKHEVDFDERSVSENQKNYEEVVDLGGDRVPVLITRTFKIEGFIEGEVSNILIDRGHIQGLERSR